MCDPISIIGGAIAAITTVGTTVYSNNQSKKAEKRQQAAQEQLAKQAKQPSNTISNTAKTATINEPTQKRTLSSLRIPSNNTATTVNTTDNLTGLNIPM